MTADEFLALGLQALQNDSENGVCADKPAKLSTREFRLMCVLDRIATGDVKSRKVREYAKSMLESWHADVNVSSAAS